MKKRDPIISLIEDIKTLKIQGASSIIETSLKVIAEEIKRQRIKTKDELADIFQQIKQARVTEPLVLNCFNYLLWQSGKEKVIDLSSAGISIEVLLAKLAMIKEQIVENSTGLVKDGFNILTHCHSSNVEQILIKAKNKGINFKVFLTETRPKFQGRITAERLVNAGLKTTMIADSESTYLLSSESGTKINLVILGADAIFPDGSCYNKTGSYGISLSAKSEKIPLYIAATLLKFFPDKSLPIEERPTTEVWLEKPKKLKILNPAFDQIPASFITQYITEFGLIKPNEIQKQVSKNYSWIINKNKRLNSRLYFKQEIKNKEQLSYLHIGEKINLAKHLVATFKIKSQEKLEAVAEDLAAESSIGTWTKLTTQTKEIFDRLSAKIFDIDKNTGLVKVAYPLDLFEPGNIPQLLSSIAGNIFGMKKIHWLRLVDLDLPEEYIVCFPGPQIGADKIREITEVFTAPLIGCIIKPKMGLSFQEHAKIALEVFEAGVNLVKDDENLTNQVFNPLEKRVTEVIKNLKLKIKNWRDKIYAFNVTAETETMIKRAKFIKQAGGNCAMIDILTGGFSGLTALRKQNLGLILHGHRAMHAALTKNPDHGISMLVIAKLARLAGVDQLHTGTIIGKMTGNKDEVIAVNKFLLADWYGLKKTLPIASGGLHPALIPDLIKILGNNVLLNFGGGIHGHPLGSKAGVMAVGQTIEAVKRKIRLEDYAKNHLELKVALEYWR